MARRTPTRRPDLPPFPWEGRRAGDIRYIHAYCALKNDAAAARLTAMRETVLRKSKFAETPSSHALWQGFITTDAAAKKDFTDARRAGELLFCWHGTRATEVSA